MAKFLSVLAIFLSITRVAGAAYVTGAKLTTQLDAYARVADSSSRKSDPEVVAGVAYVLGATDAMNGRQFCIPPM